MLHSLGKWDASWLQALLFHKTQKKPSAPQKTETQNHAQKSHAILLCPSEHKVTRQTAFQLQVPWSLLTQPVPPLPCNSFLLQAWDHCQLLQLAMQGLHLGGLTPMSGSQSNRRAASLPSLHLNFLAQASLSPGRVQLPSHLLLFPG